MFNFCHSEKQRLINEFGDEVTIKTDCEIILPTDYSSDDVEDLKEAIFHEVKHTIEFATIKAEYSKSQKWPSEGEANGLLTNDYGISAFKRHYLNRKTLAKLYFFLAFYFIHLLAWRR